MDVWNFNAQFSNGNPISIRVPTNIPLDQARAIAEKYGNDLGQVPAFARDAFNRVDVLPDQKAFWGGNGQITLPADINGGGSHIEEVIVHELAHNLDHRDHISNSSTWQNAMASDSGSASNYAKSNAGEDFAETFVLWVVSVLEQLSNSGAYEQSLGNRFDVLDELYGNDIQAYA